MDIKEIIFKIIIPSGIVGVIGTLVGIAIKHFLDKKKGNSDWLKAKQKTINHLTIVLTNFEENVDNQLSRQWELSYSEYEFPFEEDLIQAINKHLDELIALSLKTGKYGRELKKELTAFQEFIDHQESIAENIAREILFKEGINSYSEEYSHELFQLSQNQRYHEWEMHLTNISHYSKLLAFYLSDFAIDKETKKELKVISGNSFWKEKIAKFFHNSNYHY